MNKREMFNYYKECYYFEVQHKDSINARIAIPIGVMPFIIAADIYIINNLKYITPYWKLMALITVVLFSIGIILTVFFIFKTLYNHKYGYTSSPLDIYNYKKSLIKEGYEQEIIENEITDFLSEQFIEYSTKNRNANFIKVYYLRMVYYCLVITLIVGLFSVLPFSFGKNSESEIQEIKLINYLTEEVILDE